MSAEKRDKPGFADRWSRLKQDAKASPEDAETQIGAEPEAPVEDSQIKDDRSDEEILAELELPNPDTLKSGDDFRAFMARAVPARLRNRALRKLWISNPVLANLDELIDYGEDFTDAANVIENLQTSYQVGKGFVDKVAELSKEDEGSAREPAGEPIEASTQESEEKQVEAGEESPEENAVEDGDPADLPEFETSVETVVRQTIPEPRSPVRQRMRFRVTEE